NYLRIGFVLCQAPVTYVPRLTRQAEAAVGMRAEIDAIALLPAQTAYVAFQCRQALSSSVGQTGLPDRPSRLIPEHREEIDHDLGHIRSRKILGFSGDSHRPMQRNWLMLVIEERQIARPCRIRLMQVLSTYSGELNANST